MRRLLVSVTCFLSLGVCCSAWAQQPRIIFLAPVAGEDSVEVQPTISLRASLRIDRSSVRAFRDSARYTDASRPTFLLLPKLLADSLVDTLQPLLAVRGSYEISSDTLRFTPEGKLLFNTTYVLKVHGLRTINDGTVGPSPEAIAIRDTSITFSTAADVHHLMSMSALQSPWIGCGDAVTLRFDRKLACDTAVSGALITLERLDSVAYDTDTTWHYATSSVRGATWLNKADSSQLLFKSSAVLTPGAGYFLHAYVSRLTGDPADDRIVPVRVREAFAVNVGAAAEQASQGTPSPNLISHNGQIIVAEGDTLTVAAFRQDRRFAFLRWESPDDPALDGSTSPVLRIARNCSSLKDVTLRGVFRKRDTLTLHVNSAARIGVTVSRYDAISGMTNSMGGPGTYRIAPGEGLTVLARPDYANGGSFKGWSSSSGAFDGNTSPRITVRNDGPITGGTISLNPNPWMSLPADYGLCADAFWIDDWTLPETAIEPADVVTLSPSGCITASAPGSSRTVTATLSNDCYEIAEIYIDGPGISLNVKWPKGTGPKSWSSPGPLPLTNPFTKVLIAIRPKVYTLDLETVLANIGDEGGTYRTRIGQARDVRIGVYMVNPRTGNVMPRMFSADGAHDSTSNTESSTNANITLMCGEKLRLVGETQFTAIGEEGYTFTHWDSTAGYSRPAPITTNPFQYLVMDGNKRVKGYFDDGLRLRFVGLYRNDKTSSADIEWYLPRQLKRQLYDDGNMFDVPAYGHGTKLRFRFNSPVEPASLPFRFAFTDLTERIDYADPKSYSTQYGGNTAGNVSLSSSNRIVELTLRTFDGAIGIPKAERYRAEVKSGITGPNGNALKNPSTFEAETEMPELQVKVKQITPLQTQGDGGVEMFTAVAGNIMRSDGTTVAAIPSHRQLPGAYCYDYVYPGTPAAYNALVLSYPKMKKDWIATLALGTFDNDDEYDCAHDADGIYWNWKVAAAFAGMIGFETAAFAATALVQAYLAGMIGATLNGVAVSSQVLSAVGIVVGAAAAFVVATLAAFGLIYLLTRLTDFLESLMNADDPDPMGILHMRLMWSTWFGAHGPGHGVHVIRDAGGNVEWEVETQLF